MVGSGVLFLKVGMRSNYSDFEVFCHSDSNVSCVGPMICSAGQRSSGTTFFVSFLSFMVFVFLVVGAFSVSFFQ